MNGNVELGSTEPSIMMQGGPWWLNYVILSMYFAHKPA